MNANARCYQTFIFDCDGVILNSNSIKTEAFRKVASRYGEDAALALVQHHVDHGGISRFEKFRYLVSNVLGLEVNAKEIDSLCSAYAEEVYGGLLRCAISPELTQLRQTVPNSRWMIVSGGAEEELRSVFAARGIDHLFDGGIFGSPMTKDYIFSRELSSGSLVTPAVFFGDSAYDHQSAVRAGLDFVFVSGWSEFAGWQDYCRNQGVHHESDLRAALVYASRSAVQSQPY